MLRNATLIRIAPAVERDGAARIRDLAAWVSCPAIAGDRELGPLPLVSILALIDGGGPDEELTPELLAGIAASYNGLPILLAPTDGPDGWAVLWVGLITPTTWAIPTPP
jgi:hypothetical protein